MAIKLIANYAKRLGLPGYSSHQFSISIETELHEVSDIAAESGRLYQTLQQSVDEQIQQTGFVPPDGYGTNGNGAHQRNDGHSRQIGDWQCSGKQRDLIERVIRENNLEKGQVEQLATEMFGQGLESLNRLAASGLIDELLERYGNRPRNGNRNGRTREPVKSHDRPR